MDWLRPLRAPPPVQFPHRTEQAIGSCAAEDRLRGLPQPRKGLPKRRSHRAVHPRCPRTKRPRCHWNAASAPARLARARSARANPEFASTPRAAPAPATASRLQGSEMNDLRTTLFVLVAFSWHGLKSSIGMNSPPLQSVGRTAEINCA